jgi:hypothetical protein
MLAKKSPPHIIPARGCRRELQQLYERRSAIDMLIQSLQEYDRFREKRTPEERRQKTA